MIVFLVRKIGRAAWEGSLTLQRVALIALALVAAGLITAEVIFRYFLKLPLMFVEELCVYLIFWLYMLGSAYAAYERSHIKGEITSLVFKTPGVQRGFKAGAAFVALGLSCVMSVWGYQCFMWDLSIGPETQMLFLPIAYTRLSMLVGFALMAIYFLAEVIDLVRAPKSPGE